MTMTVITNIQSNLAKGRIAVLSPLVRYCGQKSSLLWIPVLRPYVGPMCQERKGTDWCMRVYA